MDNNEKIEIITEKLFKTRTKLAKVRAKEENLRYQLDQLLAKTNKQTEKVTLDNNQTMTLTRRENYSIPKASIPDIKNNIPETVFNDLFTTSYKLKTAVYNNLSGECKETVKKHQVIKPAPLGVTVKDIN